MTVSIKVIPNSALYVSEPNPYMFGNTSNPIHDPNWTNKNWLKSRFHFSFAEYHNSHNSNYGVLRVMNDDLVQPKRGFGEHPHQNMEIITYVVNGELTHEDSMGTKESLGRGSIQFMTAGTGIRHSEYNKNENQPVRFIQTWIVPSQTSLKPNYGSYVSSIEQRKNKLHHIVSNVNDPYTTTPVEVNQDVDAYVAEMDPGISIVHEISKGRQGYLLCMEGSIRVNGNQLNPYDACEISAGTASGGNIEIEAIPTTGEENGESLDSTKSDSVTHILLYTMKHVPGSGRSDI